MLTNIQLYGTEDVPPINKEDCNRRIAMLKAHRAMIYDKAEANYILVKIDEAIKFWTRMKHGENEYE